MNDLRETYDKRSKSRVNNFILWVRGEYYKYVIIPVIKEFIKQASTDWWSVLCGKIVERWSGQWHKMSKIIEWLLWERFEFFWIEPSEWMRQIAAQRFKDDKRVTFIDWFAENIPFKDDTIDFIFDIQMQHHHTDDKKRDMIREAHRVLKKWGHIYILDTFIPPDKDMLSGVRQRVFELLGWCYVDNIWKCEYHNGKLEDSIGMLEGEGLTINERYSRWFRVFLWHILGFDFINQIIATKK